MRRRPHLTVALLGPLVLGGAGGCTAAGEGGGTPTGTSAADAATPSPGTSPEPDAVPEGAAPDQDVATFERALRRTLTLPPVPAFTIPTALLSTAENQRIAGDLSIPPGLYEGIAVLDARCTDAGAAAADTGATVVRRSQHADDGTVSITVAADGTGVYDGPDLHVAVLPGGAGVYDDGTTRLSVAPDGSGTYESGDVRYTVSADGSGSLDGPGTRVWVDADGAGGYEDPTLRVSWRADGTEFGDEDPGRVAVVRSALADGLPRFPPVPRVELVEPTGTVCGTVIRLDANVLFDVDRADVRPEGQETLSRVAALLTSLGGPRAQVVGHTDSVGDDAYNQDLSERRAAAVQGLLVAGGVEEGSVEAVGRGETQPVRVETLADGTPDLAARQFNRRVEIVLLD